ncbi:MAG TPA: hypothetical protein VF519_07500 [Mycobacteriales bacterium]|jgi:hypothetical protein
MLKKIIAATAVAGALAIPAGSASAAVFCLHLDVNVNGTQQVIDQCTPVA